MGKLVLGSGCGRGNWEHVVSNAIREIRAQFENGWAEISRVYGTMLAPKTMTVAKGIAWNTYLRGRTDEMARQLAASRATTFLRKRKGVGHAAPVE